MSPDLDDVFSGMWDIFDDVGFLTAATVQPETGEPFDVSVDFRTDAAFEFDGVAQTVDFSIIYRVADVALKRYSRLTVKGIDYRCKRDPQSDSSGINATVELEKVP